MLQQHIDFMEGLFASCSHYLTTPGLAKNVGYRKRYGAVMNAGGFLPGVHSQGLCKYQCAQRCRMRIRGGEVTLAGTQSPGR